MLKLKPNIIILIIVLIIILGFSSYKIYDYFQTMENNNIRCTTYTDCKSCTTANTYGCVWCKESNICVSDLSSNILCPRQSKASSPSSCEITLSTTPSTRINSPLFGGKCANNNNCSTCLQSPGCTWCNNSKVCTSDLYKECQNEESKDIYTSYSQCLLRSSTTTPQKPEDTKAFIPSDSVIPTQGLTRNADGLLTNTALGSIFDAFSARGNPITDTQSKNDALALINKELEYYTKEYQGNIHNFVDKSMEYIADGTSLGNAKRNNQHIQDLKDISRFIKNYSSSFFNEGFISTYTSVEENKFSNILEINRGVGMILEQYWFANLIALGTLFYFITTD